MSSPVQDPNLSSILTPPDPGISHNNETGNNTASNSDSDNNDNKPNRIVAENRPTFSQKMMILCKEITIMVLIAATYAALTNENPLKVIKSPAAYPFFPKNSLVTDWYRGQITEAIEEARSSDIAFVMFYAPWDAESQAARKQFELTAKFVQDKVTFAAINCWQPGSECKRQYSKVYKWPILIAYPTHGRGIQYNGPLEVFHMIAFLNNIYKPIVRPFHIDDLIGKHDTIILANIDVLPGSREYAVFYATALRFLERDPFRNIVFAVNSQKRETKPSMNIHVWNGTVTYQGEWNVEALSSWILKKIQQVVVWVTPTGSKSLTLSTYVQPGPVLILFTPKNPLLPEIDYYNMLRELAYDYYQCVNETQIANKQKLIKLERLKSYEKYKKLQQKCIPTGANRRELVVTDTPNLWTNSSLKDFCNCRDGQAINKVCQQSTHSLSTAEELVKVEVEDPTCQDFFLTQKYASAIFEKPAPQRGCNITGLACKTNLTLTFIAMNSFKFYHFAEKLGVDLANTTDKSAVVIIDDQMETHYVMEGELNTSNLSLFVHNFTQTVLQRSLHSSVAVKSKTTHVYSHVTVKSNQISISELTSKNFLKVVMQTNKVVIVFYHSKQCAFCNGISYVFLTVAKILQTVDEIIFARIDGDTNLLPWEYTMETYPAILFFPLIRKAETRAFPKRMLITVPNLLGFILTNVDPILKLKTMWSICHQTKFDMEKDKCITSVRVEALSTINNTLREWRNSTRKQHVLYKLQILRHLHLLFAHHPSKTSTIRSYFNKLKY